MGLTGIPPPAELCPAPGGGGGAGGGGGGGVPTARNAAASLYCHRHRGGGECRLGLGRERLQHLLLDRRRITCHQGHRVHTGG